ncbi:MAG TPA: alpha/beta hydrolase [Chitinophagaceae bacterium]|jgi:pimeloyl-ACP methyl ester carboxylesterase
MKGLLALLGIMGFVSAGAQGVVRKLEPLACPVTVDSSFHTHCAYLLVPENRKKKNSPLIKVSFIVLESKNPHKRKDPVLFTNGGPGNSSLGSAAGVAKSTLVNDRDYIAFEQRGTRFAVPYLRYFDLDTALKQSYLNNLNKDSMWMVGVRKYRKTLQAKGIDFAGYNSDETVADMDDLLATLAIDSVNLWGVSYSGILTLSLLQKDPARIRSVVLDSPLPPFVAIDEDEPAHFNEALTILARHAREDSSDRERYGNLMNDFSSYFTRIKDSVFYFPYLERGKKDSVLIAYTKNDLLQTVEDGLSNSSRLKDVPFIITEIIRGNHAPYIKARLDNVFNKNTAPDGMRMLVYCADQTAYHSEAVIHDLYKIYPWMEGFHINDVYKPICDCWNVPPVNKSSKEPFYSRVPILLGDGEMDPACCPLYIDMIHHYMPNSQRALFRNRSHGVGGPDWRVLMQTFLDKPLEPLSSSNKDVLIY